MTSEGTDTLVLAFTSKTGLPVARNTRIFFYFDFSTRERIDILRYFIGLISDSRRKEFSR